VPPTPARGVRLRPERTTWFAVALFALTSLPLVASSPLLVPLLLLPAAAVVWVVRARVVAAPVGLEVCNGLVPRRTTWEQVEGFDVPPRGAPRVVLTDGRRWRMTAIDRRQLPEVLAVHDAAVRAG
jgi:hypothetical protein